MNPVVMINGMPGKMGQAVTDACLKRNWTVIPYSFAGPSCQPNSIYEYAGIDFKLIHPDDCEDAIQGILAEYPEFITVDYTHPSAVNLNGSFYVRHGLPFVMGTTGGDREALKAEVAKSGVPAVIAPNMAKQIVGFQAMMEMMAEQFPGLYEGYRLEVIESHQVTKADTSGTAKAVVASLNQMGLKETIEEATLIRTVEEQKQMGIPDEYLTGHAFHTYNIDSEDGSVHFEFQHNVLGRSVYGEGTADAVGFLAQKGQKPGSNLYDMIDVLKSGSMS